MILPYQEYSSELLCLHAYRARNPFKFMVACSLNALFVQANNSSMFDNPIIQMRKEKDVYHRSRKPVKEQTSFV